MRKEFSVDLTGSDVDLLYILLVSLIGIKIPFTLGIFGLLNIPRFDFDFK